jgi:pre-mRNA-splicing factor CWC26
VSNCTAKTNWKQFTENLSHQRFPFLLLKMSLSAYLAKNYLTASNSNSTDPDSTRPQKRRKRDKTTYPTGLIIADDDEDLQLSSRPSKTNDENDAEYAQFDGTARSAEFRKSKKNNWNVISTTSQPQDAGADEADQILARAAADAEQARAELEMEDAPTIAGVVEDGPKMESGARAGLQTAADTAALEMEEARRRNAEAKARKMRRKEHGQDGDGEPEEQTVYRDATGRRIDVSMKRAEARAAEAEKLRLERKEKEDAMGDVQRQQKEQRKQDLEDAKFLTVARGVDDEEMNEELKAQVRWDDPMALYMAQKEREEGGGKSGKSAVVAAAARPRKEYAGAAPPNRYGIKPGWRWDGVDRGNGFEKEWFQARGRKSRNENLSYQWQMDE